MRQKISELFGSFIGIFFILFLFYGEIFGIVHSARKHGVTDTILSAVIPPYAWYRSVEMWWHDDFADVDWEERLNTDLKTCVYFLSETINKDANAYQLNEDIEKFSKKINKYPEDKKNHLKDGFRKYIAFQHSIVNDLFISFESYFNGEEFSFKVSKNSNELEKDLVNYISKSDLEIIKNEMESVSNNFKPEKETLSKEKRDEIITYMQYRIKNQKLKAEQLFEMIFHESL